MNIERITTWDALFSLRDRWNALAGDDLMMRWNWLATWWKHYGEGQRNNQELFVLAAFETEVDESGNSSKRLVGIAPWLLRHTKAQGTLIELLGEEEVCTDRHHLICETSNVVEFAAGLANYLIETFRDWDALSLYGVDEGEPSYAAFFDALHELGYGKPWRIPVYQCWEIPLPNDWEAFLAMLSRSHRSWIRRYMKRIKREHDFETRSITDRASMEYAWETLVDLHQRRWNSLGEPGCFASSRFTAFHREVIDYMYESNNLEIEVVHIDGLAVCADYNLITPNKTLAYQSGINPDAMQFNPGKVATIVCVQRAVDLGRSAYDYVRGDESYKHHWRAVNNIAWHYRLANLKPMSKIRNTGFTTVKSTKRWVKSRLANLKEFSFSNVKPEADNDE